MNSIFEEIENDDQNEVRIQSFRLAKSRRLGTVQRNGKSVLHYALERDRLGIVKNLLKEYRDMLPINTPDSDGLYPLDYASLNSNDVLVKLLLESGANPDLGMALFYAGSKSVIDLLLNYGADLNRKTGGFSLVRQFYDGEWFFNDDNEGLKWEYLVQLGANLSSEDEDGYTFYEFLIENDPEALERLHEIQPPPIMKGAV